MVPVIGYARTDRVERLHKMERDISPHSHNSDDSSSGSSRIEASNERLRRPCQPSFEPIHHVPPGEASFSKIEDYCLGKPQKVSQSHSGSVELFISLQEKAVFLPTVKKSHRHRHNRRSQNQRNSDADHNRHSRENHHSSTQGPGLPRGEADVASSEHRTRPRQGSEASHASDSSSGANSSSGIQTRSPNPRSSESLAYEHEHEHELEDEDAENSGGEHVETRNDYMEAPPTFTENGGDASGETDDESSSPCSTLRGSVLLKLSKPTKIKEIGVNFFCVSRTLWNLLPQPTLFVDSALPNNAQVEDLAYLGIHRWDFVPLKQFGAAQSSYDRVNAGQSSTLIGQDLFGADAAITKDKPSEVKQRKYSRLYNSQVCKTRGQEDHHVPVFGPLASQPRKLKQNNLQVDGVVFPAGSYVYNFTLLIDAKTPVSVAVPNGQVKFVLGAKVVRAGPFTLNVSGNVDVDVVRAPQGYSEATGGGPQNDAVLISRVWEDSLVYSMSLEHRNITLDVPTKLTLVLMPLSDPDVRVHQVQIFATETITYIYSLDHAIRYVDPNLKLLLSQKGAPEGTKGQGLISSTTDSTTIETVITLVSEYNPTPNKFAIEPCQKGRYGECRFFEPDVKGPFIRVRHRLLVMLHVSRAKPGERKREKFEIKIDTPITVLSRHCVKANISLPCYPCGDGASSSENEELDDGESPPSFDAAMEHRLLGPPGAANANARGIKACFSRVEPEN